MISLNPGSRQHSLGTHTHTYVCLCVRVRICIRLSVSVTLSVSLYQVGSRSVCLCLCLCLRVRVCPCLSLPSLSSLACLLCGDSGACRPPCAQPLSLCLSVSVSLSLCLFLFSRLGRGVASAPVSLSLCFALLGVRATPSPRVSATPSLMLKDCLSCIRGPRGATVWLMAPEACGMNGRNI